MARVEIEIPPPCGGDTVVVPVVACGENVDRLTALKIGDTVRVAGRLELDSPRPPGIEPIRIHARIIWTETFAPATATTSEKATSAT
jgi:hypothetical protein